MVVQFKNEELEEIYKSGKEKGKPRYGKEIIKMFIRKIDMVLSIDNSMLLTKYQSLHFEALTKELKYRGMHSIRVNDKYRIILKIIKEKKDLEIVEISEIYDLTDYH